MNSKLFLKLFLFFVGIELIVIWLAYINLPLIFIGIVNTLAIVYMFFNFKFDSYINYIISAFYNLINLFSKLKEKIADKKINDNKDVFKHILNHELFEAIRYFFVHYGFVFSILILSLSIADHIVFNNFNTNLTFSIIFFIISFFFAYKNILSWDIYIWNKLIGSKDIVLLFDILFTISIFVFLQNFNFSSRLFFSLFAWIVFYLFTVYMLDFTKTPLKLFKTTFVNIYLLIVVFSFVFFLFDNIPSIKDYFIIEKKIIKEKPVEKIVYKEKEIDNDEQDKTEEQQFTVYIAPNGKYYEIFTTTTWVYFTWYANKKKYFTSIQEAKDTIDKFNPVKTVKEQDTLYIKENNIQEDDNQLYKVMSSLLNDEELDITWVDIQKVQYVDNSQDELTKTMSALLKEDETLTYYDVIPYIIEKFNLSSENESDINFKYINKENTNYEAFKTAYYYKMFGKSSNPNTKVRCQNLAVIIGLANNWKLNYTSETVFDIFWQKALENWYKFNTCCKSKYDYITQEKISCILK